MRKALLLFLVFLFLASTAQAADEIYEKNGVTYIIGKPKQPEKETAEDEYSEKKETNLKKPTSRGVKTGIREPEMPVIKRRRETSGEHTRRKSKELKKKRQKLKKAHKDSFRK